MEETGRAAAQTDPTHRTEQRPLRQTPAHRTEQRPLKQTPAHRTEQRQGIRHMVLTVQTVGNTRHFMNDLR